MANVLVTDYSAAAHIADGAVLTLAPATGTADSTNALSVTAETTDDILL